MLTEPPLGPADELARLRSAPQPANLSHDAFTEATTPQGNIGIKCWVNNGDYVTGEINDTTDAQAGGQKRPQRRRRG